MTAHTAPRTTARLTRVITGAALTAALLAPAAIATADDAVSVNRGACMSQISPELKRYQAPGQIGAAPFTIVNGVHHVAPAFGGAIGCYHD